MIVKEAELRLLLNMQGSPESDLMVLQTMHTEAESLVVEHLKYDPEQRTHVEYYPAHDPGGGLAIEHERTYEFGSSRHYMAPAARLSRNLQMRHLPVRKVKSCRVHCDCNFGANDILEDVIEESGKIQDEPHPFELVQGRDYYPENTKRNWCRSGNLIHCSGWSVIPGSIRVEYVAGYSPGELQGRPDAMSAELDAARGVITCPGENASGIKRAVTLTVAKGMHTWSNIKKGEGEKGFGGGSIFDSERLQDYSYNRGSGSAATAQLTGLIRALPDEAKDSLQTFVHYGTLAL